MLQSQLIHATELSGTADNASIEIHFVPVDAGYMGETTVRNLPHTVDRLPRPCICVEHHHVIHFHVMVGPAEQEDPVAHDLHRAEGALAGLDLPHHLQSLPGAGVEVQLVEIIPIALSSVAPEHEDVMVVVQHASVSHTAHGFVGSVDLDLLPRPVHCIQDVCAIVVHVANVPAPMDHHVVLPPDNSCVASSMWGDGTSAFSSAPCARCYIISVHIVKAIVSIVASKHDQHARRHRTTMGPTLAWRFAIGREFVPTICFEIEGRDIVVKLPLL
mmetsp:Transcript_29134/g.49698  ORF Transcript_29134/g.49698 Transcript_29134/m.49698 type:complete len:273 (-) Transcript_29134:156-974(-)